MNLILTNANVVTMDPLQPSARTVCIKGGKVIRLGQEGDAIEFPSADFEMIDCQEKTVLPGFIDAHMHLHAFAESLITLDLTPATGCRSIEMIQEALRSQSRHLPERRWIRASGYNEFYLSEKRHPTRYDLDEVVPHHPVKLTHRSGHAHVLNSLALKLVGISAETPDPPGGLIERNLQTGEPTGLLFEMGEFLSRSIPPLDQEAMDRGVGSASENLLSLGITSVQDATYSRNCERWRDISRWKERAIFRPRVSMMLGMFGSEEFNRGDYSSGVHQDQLRLGAAKIVVDQTTGEIYPRQSDLNEMVSRNHRLGLQVAIHAIEEPAVESACIAIEQALRALPRSDHRHRIEHCSVCRPEMARRLAPLGILVVTQPSFIYYHGDRYLATVPSDQVDHLYPIRTLIESGICVAAGSDSPIVPPNPLIALYSVVSRRSKSGQTVLAKEAVNLKEAIRMFTQNAAKATFEEEFKGTIAPGKAADLVILSSDIMKASLEEIPHLEVEATILNGEVVWEKGS
jgi:predicted amidohydrolase YtcJ